LPMETISIDDDLTDGIVIVGKSLSSADKGKDGKKKRKSEVVLASGDQGREASSAMDLAQDSRKRTKRADDDDDDGEGFEELEGDDKEQSIADRLALLSSAMEQTDEETDDDEDDNDGEEVKADQLRVRSATSETLTAILTQALSSNDSARLNVALQATDRRLVENTVRSLQALDAGREDADTTVAGYLPTLMAHVVRRMVRRHSLAMPLGVWVRAIIAATAHATMTSAGAGEGNSGRMAREGREMALSLGPLRNFLNERAECFPQLLRLEGRLALLDHQSRP